MSVEAKRKRVSQLIEKQQRIKQDLDSATESLKTARAELKEEEKKEKAALKAEAKKATVAANGKG